MANADTRDKRGSAISLMKAQLRLEQNPSGTIAQSGRQFAAYSYTGILATNPATFNPAWAWKANTTVGLTIEPK